MYDRTTDDMKINNYDVDNLTEIDFCDMGSVKNFVVNHVNCGKSVSVGVGFSEVSSRRGRSSFAVDGRTNGSFVRRAKTSLLFFF